MPVGAPLPSPLAQSWPYWFPTTELNLNADNFLDPSTLFKYIFTQGLPTNKQTTISKPSERVIQEPELSANETTDPEP